MPRAFTDVPPWARQMVEALRKLGYALRRHGEDFENGQHDGLLQRRGDELESICRAVLAAVSSPDAGTGESATQTIQGAVRVTVSRRVIWIRGGTMSGGQLRAMLTVPDDHDLWWISPVDDDELVKDDAEWVVRDGQRYYTAPKFINAGSPAPASGAAPEERDAELEDLLNELEVEQVTFGRVEAHGGDAQAYFDEARKIWHRIQLHVAQRERAAREAGRELCSVCAGTGKPVSGILCICGGAGTQSAEVRGLRQELFRLQDDAGEVVGTGITVAGQFSPFDGKPSTVTVQLDAPVRVIRPDTRVALVRRRGKEEG